jgi:hypothetical protein
MNTTTAAETIDLSHYYFTGPDFNWQNIALTLDEWPNPQWANGEHGAHINTDTRDLFWISYGDIGLFFGIDEPTIVCWNHANGEFGGDGIRTSTTLPRDSASLLQFLNLTVHPEAQNIFDFWMRLRKFLPHLEAE